MATISMCAPPVEETPFLTLTLTRTEARALREILGEVGGGYGRPVTVSNVKDTNGELRAPLDRIFMSLDEVGSL